jgi:hypothetical protein
MNRDLAGDLLLGADPGVTGGPVLDNYCVIADYAGASIFAERDT